jgi:hypothetical protein
MATANIKNTAERRYWVSTREDSSESNPDNILSNLADGGVKEHILNNEYAGDQDDLKNKDFIDDQYIVSDMPETFNDDVKLDHEGRLYKYIGSEWHVYDIMDDLPITDESGDPLTLDVVSGSAEYPSFSDISAGASTSHRLVLTKSALPSGKYIYSMNLIYYGMTTVDNLQRYVYSADVDCLLGSETKVIDRRACYEPAADGLFYYHKDMYGLDDTVLAFSYKPVYHIKVYAGADVSGLSYVRCFIYKASGSESAIAVESSSSDSKIFTLRNMDDANDTKDSPAYSMIRVYGTKTSPDQIMLEVW